MILIKVDFMNKEKHRRWSRNCEPHFRLYSCLHIKHEDEETSFAVDPECEFVLGGVLLPSGYSHYCAFYSAWLDLYPM